MKQDNIEKEEELPQILINIRYYSTQILQYTAVNMARADMTDVDSLLR